MIRRTRYRWLAFAVLLCTPANVLGAEPCSRGAVAWDTPTALVLSGGGAKGAWEAGMAAGLAEAGLPIALVAGSSAGALNAALLAAGHGDHLDALWRGLERDKVYRLRAPIALAGLLPGWLTLLALDRAGSLFDPAPLRVLIEGGIELDRIRQSPIRLVVTTTDLERRRTRIFDNASVTVDALMAAAAVPGAFPPVEVDGALLVDGGLTGRAPVLEALEAGARVGRALVLMSYSPDERGTRPTTMRHAIEEAFETSMIHQIRRDTELARLRHPAIDIHLITPSAPLNLRPLDFDPSAIARALELGRADARACAAVWRRLE